MPSAWKPLCWHSGSGMMRIQSMIKAGFALNIFGVFLVTALCYGLVGWLWAR